MRSRKILMIAGFLVTWTYVIIYFMPKVNTELPLLRNRHEQAVQQLEDGVRQEYHKTDKLMINLLGILQAKYATEAPEKEIRIQALPQNSQTILSLQEPPAIGPDQELQQDVLETPNETQTSHRPQTEIPSTVATRLANNQPVIPVLVFACNRISISKCLDNLIKYRPSTEQFPIIVSQDCGDEATRNVILSYDQQVSLIEQPDQTDIFVPPKEKKFKGYYKIARHYGWALNNTFSKGYEFVIIVEDDLNVAPDFFEYFLGTHHLLKQDSSLWCVSAWNDNGKANLIDSTHPELLYRTDFFPGLGWMLTKELWQELSVKWPKSFWDDWIRHPEQRKNRVCIRPEISRTRTFGKVGVSNGLFFDKYLRYIKLSEEFVPFTKMNLSYLLKDNYDKTFLKEIYTYPVVTYDELRRNLITRDGPVRIQYNTREVYKRTTKMLGLMDDFKSGVPRTAYHGVVSFMHNKRRVYLAPNVNWKGYDLSWS
ncbi:alpha-1,3-mannosyl-glycoprotein 2-beta-N-acetylglucosaminyltransferase [Stomoxys calcitrans]|uniref:alpha-1,3-mannosyl-glycoprotein 2-beta-N-acetylglucosaminyltransferase n=1 Tax=Stomoxys calcitrans TaxID=35570 RepID=UPI0027E23782|nr:alpha-1,3-mannosyl-glycoprotein 2-beta-N-acetylglucosaminyltransferase [Stomoxys calcitrans]